jgi:hypothetical protein
MKPIAGQASGQLARGAGRLGRHAAVGCARARCCSALQGHPALSAARASRFPVCSNVCVNIPRMCVVICVVICAISSARE